MFINLNCNPFDSRQSRTCSGNWVVHLALWLIYKYENDLRSMKWRNFSCPVSKHFTLWFALCNKDPSVSVLILFIFTFCTLTAWDHGLKIFSVCSKIALSLSGYSKRKYSNTCFITLKRNCRILFIKSNPKNSLLENKKLIIENWHKNHQSEIYFDGLKRDLNWSCHFFDTSRLSCWIMSKMTASMKEVC